MKNHILPSTLLTLCCIVFFCGAYTLVVWGVAQFAPNHGNGEIVSYGANNSRYGFSNVGQNFSDDKYFWSRPSAVGYNAAGSAGSNKGPSNPDYLAQVQARIDTFLLHNPAIKKEQVVADLVTASGSGLDPDISPEGAMIQVPRVAKLRGVSEEKIKTLVNDFTEQPLLGLFGPSKINVLKLNLALDSMK
jgi:potassium-transporting ATPase KdpC subunit